MLKSFAPMLLLLLLANNLVLVPANEPADGDGSGRHVFVSRQERSFRAEKHKCSANCEQRCRNAQHRDGECQGTIGNYHCVCFN
ncbi:hypothetical protein BV898_10352 [Hypsibius exemplaris]|uniref:Invertebrate defensins family profile domain-containing protein n=1 Tax=Hypsibius exemplaris TaxID=2072580 RepID=A0A1W0WJT9_HYPEX|nr:hypothetical protein BV898_10352 [Hypsibius exemplaris]